MNTRRKPTVIHILQGGKKKTRRPLPTDEPKPAIGLPECPGHLDDEAKAEWVRMSQELASVGILTVIDKTVFAMYCQAWSQWVNACLIIRQQGLIFKAPSGYPIQTPWFSIKNKAEAQMIKCLMEIGMTPSSRSRVKAVAPKTEDELEAFLAR